MEGFGEPDAARLAGDAIIWHLTGEPSLAVADYRIRTSPLYIHAMKKCLDWGLPAARLPALVNWGNAVIGSLAAALIYLLARRLANSPLENPSPYPPHPDPLRQAEREPIRKHLFPKGEREGSIEFGRLRPEFAEAAARAVEEAAKLALAGSVAGIVTAPLTKEGLHLAGRAFPGHTEMLAALAGASGRELMLLVGGGLRVALATTHLALADVPKLITAKLVGGKLAELAAGLAQDFGLKSPRIAVLALNPHAGEGGRFGREEIAVIAPAIQAARAAGIDATGPLPADTAFHRALRGEFDAVLAMYHDQGLAVLKALAFDTGVNVTLGLPIVRTSPDHGTAYDIAGKGAASERSMLEALKLAREIATRRGI